MVGILEKSVVNFYKLLVEDVFEINTCYSKTILTDQDGLIDILHTGVAKYTRAKVEDLEEYIRIHKILPHDAVDRESVKTYMKILCEMTLKDIDACMKKYETMYENMKKYGTLYEKWEVPNK